MVYWLIHTTPLAYARVCGLQMVEMQRTIEFWGLSDSRAHIQADPPANTASLSPCSRESLWLQPRFTIF